MTIYDGWIGGGVDPQYSHVSAYHAVKQNKMDDILSTVNYITLTHPIFGELIEYEEKGSYINYTHRYIKNQVFEATLQFCGVFNGRSTGGLILKSNDVVCYLYLSDFISFLPFITSTNGESFVEGKFNFAVKGSAVGLVLSE